MDYSFSKSIRQRLVNLTTALEGFSSPRVTALNAPDICSSVHCLAIGVI